MKIIGIVKSYYISKNRDCFKNTGPAVIDHIWPLSEGGDNIKANKMLLTRKSNQLKANNTTGYINNWRFSVLKQETSDNKIYGKMLIRHRNWDDNNEWYEVEPVL